MSFWDERVTQHHIFVDIRLAKSKIEEIEFASDGDDSVLLDAKARLLAVIDRLRKSLSAVDPYLVPMQALEDISTNLSLLGRCLDDYSATSRVGHLALANTAADNILGQLSLLWSPRSAEEVEELRLAAASLRRSLDDQSRVLRTRLNEISAESSRLAAELSELRQELSQRRSQAGN